MIARPRVAVPARLGAGGFSLIEVVVAVGLLAGVLISTAALLTVGSRQVRGGGYSSEALSVSREVVERIEGWSFTQLVDQLGCPPDANPCILDSEFAGGIALEWKPRLERTMPIGAHLEILVQGLNEAASAVPLEQAAAVRLTVSVIWDEGPRRRDVRLTLVRA